MDIFAGARLIHNPQRILIVGGGQGIGWEVTKRLVFLSSQARVVAFGLHVEEAALQLQRSCPDRLCLVVGDVTSSDERQRAIEGCNQFMGGIDTLVFTAGVITPIERIESLNMDAVKRSFDINVFGCMAMV